MARWWIMAKTPKFNNAVAQKRLLTRQKELSRLMEAHADEQEPVELSQGVIGRLSRMDAMQIQAMAEETARRRDLELSRIEAALKRIEDDEYGRCVSCGNVIAPRRLANDPAAPACIDCAGRAERG